MFNALKSSKPVSTPFNTPTIAFSKSSIDPYRIYMPKLFLENVNWLRDSEKLYTKNALSDPSPIDAIKRNMINWFKRSTLFNFQSAEYFVAVRPIPKPAKVPSMPIVPINTLNIP